MDNNKSNPLSEENQKWLDDLLNAPDSQEVGAGELAKQFTKPEEAKEASPEQTIAEEEQVIREAEALVGDQKTDTDLDDIDLDAILSEDWLNEEPSVEHPKAEEPVPPQTDYLLPEENSDFEEYPTENTKKSKPTTKKPKATTPKEEKEEGESQRPKKKDGYGLFGIFY